MRGGPLVAMLEHAMTSLFRRDGIAGGVFGDACKR